MAPVYIVAERGADILKTAHQTEGLASKESPDKQIPLGAEQSKVLRSKTEL